MFTLFVPYLYLHFLCNMAIKCTKWFRFQLLIYAISAIKNIIFVKRKQITCSF